MKINKPLWLFKKAVRYCFPNFVVNILLFSFLGLLTVAMSIVNRSIINNVSVLNQNIVLYRVTIILIAAYILIFFFNSAGSFIYMLGSNYFRIKVKTFFHRIFMYKSANTPQINFFDNNYMEKYAFVSQNTDKIASYFGNIISLVFYTTSGIIATLVIFIIYEPLLLVYAGVYFIFSLLASKKLSKKNYELDKQQISEKRFHDYYKGLFTDRKGAKEIRINNTENFLYEKWEGYYDKLKSQSLNLKIKKIKLDNNNAFLKIIFRALAIAFLLFFFI